MKQALRIAVLVAVAVAPGFAPVAQGFTSVAPGFAPVKQGFSPAVTEDDILRLQIDVHDARSTLEQLQARDAALAAELESQIDEISDEAIYLKVRLRKEGSVPRADYQGLVDRLALVTAQASGGPARPAGSTGRAPLPAPLPTAGAGYLPGEIPAGQQLDARLRTELNSKTAQVEDRFEASTLVDLYKDGRLVVPAGSVLRGVVSAVDRAGRFDRGATLKLNFDQITLRGEPIPIRASVTQTFETKGVTSEATKIVTAAGLGGIVGGLIAGAPGIVAGLVVGTGGIMVATPGKNVEVPPGTILRVQFDEALPVR